MKAMTRRRSNRKPIPIHAWLRDAQATIAHHLAPLDRVAREMERTWGVDTLPTLVPFDLRTRFERALENLNRAIHDNDINAVEQKSRNLIQGWKLLDQAARKQGHQPMDQSQPYAWFHRGPKNQAYAFVRDQKDLKRVNRDQASIAWTLDEVCHIIDWYAEQPGNQVIFHLKKEFPASELTDHQNLNSNKHETEPEHDDIPF